MIVTTVTRVFCLFVVCFALFCTQCGTSHPTEPNATKEPTATTEPTVRAEPTLAREPSAPTELTGPTEPIERSEPTLAPEPPQPTEPSVFRRSNLVAWAIVPYDKKKRNATERAAMLKRLGIKRLAYDWRDEHIPSFEAEILAMKQAGIEYLAFWGIRDDAQALFLKHNIQPQLWWWSKTPPGETQEELISTAARHLLPRLDLADKTGSVLGLYNHLGWGGDPKNMAAIVKRVITVHKRTNIGIIYNFHHGHEHIADFKTSMALMKPYLLCINLNGMNDNAMPKILPVGQGKHEKEMIRIIKESGYRGLIGLIDHQFEEDTEVVLQQNIDGLKSILRELGDTDALQSY